MPFSSELVRTGFYHNFFVSFLESQIVLLPLPSCGRCGNRSGSRTAFEYFSILLPLAVEMILNSTASGSRTVFYSTTDF